MAKRAIAFFDAQNLFYAAKQSFGYNTPNFDPIKLANAVAEELNAQCVEVHFYTGVVREEDHYDHHHFALNRLRQFERDGVKVFWTYIVQREKRGFDLAGAEIKYHLIQEKGVDVKLAVDLISLTHKSAFDVAVIFSQDQDLAPAVSGAYEIAQEQHRRILVVSAFPRVKWRGNNRGILGSQWYRFNRHLFDMCRDPRNYWPRAFKDRS